ncbi:zinc ribbon domain-containing protein [Salinigranum salinum]|uniref:zinc ribbon domain-containing protein n=1 Tax=Salinigranum salinum TaxID=1364937 RepID=UPI001260AC8C|nr:zinc ribbon domain-containing protein [Salinigranum salinum]
MSEDSWRFRTTNGVVTVREDAIGIRSTPGYFLAGQRSRWRSGDRWERGKFVVSAGGLLSSILGTAYHVSQVGVAGVGLRSAPHVFAVGMFAYMFWSNHVGETTIPLSTVDTITMDEEEGTLVITHAPDHDYFDSLRSETSETTLSIPTEDDVREATEIFRLRGIDVEEPSTVEVRTTYRVIVKSGVCFCERCRSQVSPSDSTCPACGYAIRVRSSGDRTPGSVSDEAEFVS